MEACLNVERELDKVLAKFKAIDSHTASTLSDLVEHIESIKRELSEAPQETELSATQALILTQSVKKIRDTVGRISQEHKDLHGSVSKVGKAIDRNFVSDFNSILPDSLNEDGEKRNEINHVIGEHFLRQGMLDIAEELIQEAELDVSVEQKEPFLELHSILEALKLSNLLPALEWCKVNCNKLQAANSSLEFKLHRLVFIDLVRQGSDKQSEALLYARNFAPFANSHAKEVQVLMGSLLYIKQGVENSPYAYLLNPINWDEICDVFTRDACSLLGLSVESPLSVVIRAGCTALPPLLNIRQVMQQRQCAGVWSAKDELPVEIDLGTDCQYHSVFACPILRQQSNENNPPVRLVCGHVISRDALHKLANGNKVKCPYCPVEQTSADARQIFF